MRETRSITSRTGAHPSRSRSTPRDVARARDLMHDHLARGDLIEVRGGA